VDLSGFVMPRLSGSEVAAAARRPDDSDFASTDEVIVYKDEGEADDAKSGLVENLTEEKIGLLTETEQVQPYADIGAATIGVVSYGALGRVPTSTSNCLIFWATLEPHKLCHSTSCRCLSSKTAHFLLQEFRNIFARHP